MADVSASVMDPSVQDLLAAGVHFGHQSKRWNPKMKNFIFAKKNSICIIDLPKTQVLLKIARQFVFDTVASGKDMLFVGTKRQCQDLIKDAATTSGQHYVSNRWLGGTLTNFRNISTSIARMKEIEQVQKDGGFDKLPMKEVSRLRHELVRLQKNLAGLANMNAIPGVMVVVDVTREAIAVQEANKMGVPVIAIIDTNCDPDPIDFPIPGNDDGVRSIKLILDTLVSAALKAKTEYSRIAAEQAAQRQAEAEAAKTSAQAAPSSTDSAEESKPRHARSSGARERASRGGDKAKTAAAAKSAPAEAAAPSSRPAELKE